MADDSELSPLARRAIVIILVVMALLAIFSNVQRSRRNSLEKVVIERVAIPAASPSTASSPLPTAP